MNQQEMVETDGGAIPLLIIGVAAVVGLLTSCVRVDNSKTTVTNHYSIQDSASMKQVTVEAAVDVAPIKK